MRIRLKLQSCKGGGRFVVVEERGRVGWCGGGRLRECRLGSLQNGEAFIIIGAHLCPQITLTALPPLI